MKRNKEGKKKHPKEIEEEGRSQKKGGNQGESTISFAFANTSSNFHLDPFEVPCLRSNTSPISSHARMMRSMSSFVWDALTQNRTLLVTSGVAG